MKINRPEQFGIFLGILTVIYVLSAIYLEFDKEHSLQMITFLTAILASVIAFGALYFVTGRSLQYTWKRDQALRDIERIYEPCHEEISEIIPAMSSYAHMLPFTIGWSSLRKSHLAKILELKNRELYDRLELLYDFIYTEKYRDNWGKGFEIVKEIVAKEIERVWTKTLLDDKEKESAIKSILEIFNWDGHLFRDFFEGLSMQESSIKRRRKEDYSIEHIQQALSKAEYLNHFKYSRKLFDAIRNEIEANPEIQEIRKTQREFIKQAKETKEMLEGEIVEPQL